jgi:hypothetical protein
MLTDSVILAAINAHASGLHLPSGSDLDARAVLAAITWPETEWGRRLFASKSERAYMPGGKYFVKHVISLHDRYGDAASSSWGPWQQLYVSAWETGFRGHPWELTDPHKACAAAVTLLNLRCFKWWVEAPTPALRKVAEFVADVADFWNSGSFRDSIPPLPDYVAKVESAYAEAAEFYAV